MNFRKERVMNLKSLTLQKCIKENKKRGTEFILENGTVTACIIMCHGSKSRKLKRRKQHESFS